MKILGLALATDDLKPQRDFYVEALGLPLEEETETSFAIQAGYTKVVFSLSDERLAHRYLFAFHVPPERFARAWEWVEARVPTVGLDGEDGEAGRHPQGLYCADPFGNLVGFVPRRSDGVTEALTGGPLALRAVGEVALYVNRVSDAVETLQRRFELSAYEHAQGGRVALGDDDGIFVLLPKGRGSEKVEPAPIIMTIEGEANAVDRVDDAPYYIHISRGEAAINATR